MLDSGAISRDEGAKLRKRQLKRVTVLNGTEQERKIAV